MATPKAGPVVTAPDPKDVTHLQFRALRRLALNDDGVNNQNENAAKKRLQSVDVASKYGKFAAGKRSLVPKTIRKFLIILLFHFQPAAADSASSTSPIWRLWTRSPGRTSRTRTSSPTS